MKFFYVKMKNYRQYRDARIDFSTEASKSFTVVQGANGAGKSNLLNAVTWCLYGEERHLKDTDHDSQLPIVNEHVWHTLPIGDTAIVEVEVALGDIDIEYIIKRQAKVYRHPNGDFAIREDADPTVMYLLRNSWCTSEDPNYTINSLLPSSISHFFFFDGERLDKFFQAPSSQTSNVSTGIIRVSQIDLLSQTINHLDIVRSSIRRSTGDVTPEVNRLRRELDVVEASLVEKRALLQQLQHDRVGLERNIEEIHTALRNSSIDEVRRLQEDRDAIRGDLRDYQSQLERHRKDAARGLQKLGPRVFGYTAVRQTLALITREIEHGVLPPKVRVPFFQDLLDDNKCVCGCDLSEGTDARQHVIQRMNAVSTQEYADDASEGRYITKAICESVPELVSQQQEYDSSIWGVGSEIETLNRRLREISQKIEQIGGVDVHGIEVYEHQRRQYEAELRQIDQQIGREEAEKERLEAEKETLNREYLHALQQDQRQQELRERLQLCTEALEALNAIRTELLTEVRKQIEKKTEEYFLNLIWKKGTYKRVLISEDYQINLLNVRDMPSLGTLSAGERQVLALAFMAALGTVSGFDSPVIIDTPIGRISGEPREKIAESLPHYLSNTQVSLFVTDTEFTEPVQLRLQPRIGKEYQLVFDEDTGTTEVVTR